MTDPDKTDPSNAPSGSTDAPDKTAKPLDPNADTPVEVLVNDEDNAIRLDKWLSDRLEGLTRSRLKGLIEDGALTRDGNVFTDPSWRIRTGENYLLTIPAVVAPVPKGQAIPLEVHFEDDDVIVVNKPAGLVVHPAAGNWSGTLVNALIAHCGTSLSGIGGVARPGIVHRLDKDTSGLLVVAKNDAAHLALTEAFAAHSIERAYEAICVGAPRPSLGTIDAPIGRLGGDRKKMGVAKPEAKQMRAQWEVNDLDASLDTDETGPATKKGTKYAITHYKTLQAFGRGRAKLDGDAICAHVECQLETGRTHQIRVHMSHIGHPLIGDPLYGRGPGLPGLKPGDGAAETALSVLGKFKRQALHARTLGFVHPRTHEDLSFSVPPPADFLKLLSTLEAL